MPSGKKLTVFYDGACPLCDREISFFKRRRGAEYVAWVDLSGGGPQEMIAPGLSKRAALARFHVRRADGRLVSGGAAFAALWASLPGFRLDGRVFHAPPLTWVLDRAYVLFLVVRPRLQASVPPPRRRL